MRGAVLERSGDPPRLEPLAVTFRRKMDFRGIFTAEQVETDEPDLDVPRGELEVLFCRACGKVDWFVKAPNRVPIGEQFGTELVEADPATPYR